jgi:glycosyltransferase involved in cell wall biosynthesis
MIISVTIAYNEELMLPGCLESVRGLVDRMLVVDGAYALFPHEDPESTDATREIAAAYGAEVIRCPQAGGKPRAWRTQMEKRNAYLQGRDGDWYLMIDADERYRGQLPAMVDGVDYAFRVQTRELRWAWVVRLWQHRGWTRYEGAHNALWRDGELRRLEHAERVPPETAWLEHLSHLRGAERLRDKAAWLPERYAREAEYRRRYGI